TEGPGALLLGLDTRKSGLTDNPLFKQVTSFKEFPAWGRAYLDMAALIQLGKGYSPEVGRLLDDLGLDGIKSVTFQSGFDGAAERGLTEIHVPGPRKGLLRLAS